MSYDTHALHWLVPSRWSKRCEWKSENQNLFRTSFLSVKQYFIFRFSNVGRGETVRRLEGLPGEPQNLLCPAQIWWRLCRCHPGLWRCWLRSPQVNPCIGQSVLQGDFDENEESSSSVDLSEGSPGKGAWGSGRLCLSGWGEHLAGKPRGLSCSCWRTSVERTCWTVWWGGRGRNASNKRSNESGEVRRKANSPNEDWWQPAQWSRKWNHPVNFSLHQWICGFQRKASCSHQGRDETSDQNVDQKRRSTLEVCQVQIHIEEKKPPLCPCWETHCRIGISLQPLWKSLKNQLICETAQMCMNCFAIKQISQFVFLFQFALDQCSLQVREMRKGWIFKMVNGKNLYFPIRINAIEKAWNLKFLEGEGCTFFTSSLLDFTVQNLKNALLELFQK